MPETPSGIQYSVHIGNDDSPRYREQWVDGSNQATGEVQVAWIDWDDFALDFFGDAAWLPQNTGGFKLSRTLPMRHPTYPWMIGQELEILKVIGDPGKEAEGVGDYDDNATVIASVTYRAVMFDVKDDASAWADPNGELSRWTEIKRAYNAQNLTVRNSVTHWKDLPLNDPTISGTFANEATYPYSWTTFILEWNNVPTINGDLPAQLYANWDACRGRMNSTTFLGKPPGTMLCHDPKLTPFRSPNGRKQVKVEIPVEYQSEHWDFKYRGYDSGINTAPGFYQVEAVQLVSGQFIKWPYVPSADLNKLFQAV